MSPIAAVLLQPSLCLLRLHLLPRFADVDFLAVGLAEVYTIESLILLFKGC